MSRFRSGKASGTPAWLMSLGFSAWLAAGGCLGESVRPSGVGIHIGALLPYTGELAASGPSLEQGIRLALETANRAGGVAGQMLVLDVEDTHSDLTRGHQSADRLLLSGPSALLGPEEPVLAQEIAPTIAAQDAIMISGGITARGEAGAAPSLWFRVFASAKTVTSELASRMIRDKIAAASVLFVDDSYGSTFATLFAAKYTALGGRLIESVPLPQNISALKLTDSSPAALVLVTYPRTGALAVQQLSAMGFSGRWYFAPTLDSEQFLLNTSPGLLNGMIGISPALTADFADFSTQFENRWQRGEPSLGANFYYDSMAVLALALQEAHQRLGRAPTAAELATSVRSVSGPAGQTITWNELDAGLHSVASGIKVNYRGISGPIDFDKDGDVAQGLVRFWHVQDGAILRE